MRKFQYWVLLLTFAALMSGCTALGYMKSCIDDPACLAEKMDAANKTKAQVTAIAGVASPVPWVPNVAGSLAAIGTLMFGLYVGGKKKSQAQPA